MNSLTITPAERERLTNYLAETRERLLRAIKHLSWAQLDYKPASDRWSVAENVEHISIVENLVLERIKKAFEGSIDPSSGSAWQGRDDALAAEIENRARRLQAPE